MVRHSWRGALGSRLVRAGAKRHMPNRHSARPHPQSHSDGQLFVLGQVLHCDSPERERGVSSWDQPTHGAGRHGSGRQSRINAISASDEMAPEIPAVANSMT